MPHTAVALVAVLSVALAAVSSLPQCLQLVRTRDTAGLSGTAVVLCAATEAAWLSYSVALQRVAVVPADVLYLLNAAAVLWAAARLASFGRTAWLSGMAWSGLLAAAALAGSLAGVRLLLMGELLAAAVVVEGVPQLVTALRSPVLTGLSEGSQWLYLGGGVVWGAYGIMVDDWPFLTYGILQVLVVAPVLRRIRVCRHEYAAAAVG